MAAIDRLLTDQADDGRIRPSYGRWGVANVPATVASILGVDGGRPLLSPEIDRLTDRTEHVVLLVIDGLGWHRLHALRPSLPRLDHLASEAALQPLTSTYPSETAAAMITLYTGLQPVEHGLIGWFTRFESPATIGNSLPFTTLDDEPLDEVGGYDPSSLFDATHRTTVPDRLVAAGIDVTYCNPDTIVDSHASRLAAGAATRLGYDAPERALRQVAERIDTASSPTYHLVYDGAPDAAGHHDGTDASSFRDAVGRSIDALYDGLLEYLDPPVADETALLVVADHGQVNTTPETSISLDDLEANGRVAVRERLERNDAGEPVGLAGSPRNLQFHLEDGHAVDTLRGELEGALSVQTFDAHECQAVSLFGDRPPSPTFERRLPDLVAIPDEGGVWFDTGQLAFVGMHGGCHPDEMLVPLLAARASALG